MSNVQFAGLDLEAGETALREYPFLRARLAAGRSAPMGRHPRERCRRAPRLEQGRSRWLAPSV